MSEQADEYGPCAAADERDLRPRRVRLTTLLLPLLKRLAARKNEHGDENPLHVGGLWLHVYRWGSRSFRGHECWYADWHCLLGWHSWWFKAGGNRRSWVKSIYIGDTPD